jgi:hypothetical protein
MPPIVVSNLRVESITGPTCYPAENGFSALIAYVKADDVAIINQLIRASEDGATVTVRCATLEVEGKVGKFQFAKGDTKDAIAIAVDDLRYFKPHRKF